MADLKTGSHRGHDNSGMSENGKMLYTPPMLVKYGSVVSITGSGCSAGRLEGGGRVGGKTKRRVCP